MGCTSSAMAAVGGSATAMFGDVPVKINVNVSDKKDIHPRVGTKTKPKQCTFCKKEGSMMSPLKICGCCDRWACGSCQKSKDYIPTVQPVPSSCEFSKRPKTTDNANQPNSKLVCGECHEKCVFVTVKKFADESVPEIKKMNEAFKEKIIALSKNLPLPIPDTAEDRRKLLVTISGVKPLTKAEKSANLSTMALMKVQNFPPNTELCVVFPNITACSDCKPLRKLNLANKCQHGFHNGTATGACEGAAMIRATGINDCMCCGNATCRSHWHSPPLSIPHELILLNDMYVKAGLTQNVCTDCHNNLVAYWLFAMTMDSFDDAIPRLLDAMAGKRPNDFEDPKPATSMFESLSMAVGGGSSAAKGDGKSIAAALKAERIAFQYTGPSKMSLVSLLGGEKAEVVVMLFDQILDKYKEHEKKQDEEERKKNPNAHSKSSSFSLGGEQLKLMYYGSRYYDMRWKLYFTEDKGASLLKSLNITFAHDDFIGEELEPLGTAENELSKPDLAMVDEIGNWCGYAEMMYALDMPKPQDTPEWQSWYICKLLGKNWSLIHCRSDTTYYPDGRIGCAFALATRHKKRINGTKQTQDVKEAILILRGTKSFSDWHINVNKSAMKYKYHAGSDAKTLVDGQVHIGMFNSASAILDVHCMKLALMHLFDHGYTIKIIGHSLGAGTGALLTMEFKRHLFERQQKNGLKPSTNGIFDGRVSAVLYGVPAVVCKTIADALYKDKYITSVVYAHDMIPRFNEDNTNRMVRNIFCLREYANKAMSENLTQALGSLTSPKKQMTRGAAGTDDKGESGATAGAQPPDATVVAAVSPAGGKADETQPAKPIEGKGRSTSKVAPIVDGATTNAAAAATAETEQSKKEGGGDEEEEVGVLISFKVPGEIYYIFQQGDSMRYYLKKGNYSMKTLNRLWPIEDGVKHHSMSAYRSALRGLRLQNVGTLKCDFKLMNKLDPVWDSKQKWKMCAICTMDPMWVYTLKTDADKGHMSRNCSYCGKVVCVICSPAGEKVMDMKLKDRRVVSPSLGIYEPTLTCIECYLHSYEYQI